MARKYTYHELVNPAIVPVRKQRFAVPLHVEYVGSPDMDRLPKARRAQESASDWQARLRREWDDFADGAMRHKLTRTRNVTQVVWAVNEEQAQWEAALAYAARIDHKFWRSRDSTRDIIAPIAPSKLIKITLRERPKGARIASLSRGESPYPVSQARAAEKAARKAGLPAWPHRPHLDPATTTVADALRAGRDYYLALHVAAHARTVANQQAKAAHATCATQEK